MNKCSNIIPVSLTLKSEINIFHSITVRVVLEGSERKGQAILSHSE